MAAIGLILCQDRNHVVAEYALRGVTESISVSEYELTRARPTSLKSALPTVEEIEAELIEPPPKNKAARRIVARKRKKSTKQTRSCRENRKASATVDW